MAEKALVNNKPTEEKFMTVFRPQADPMLDKDGNVMGPNEALEAQRKAFENAEKNKDTQEDKAKVDEMVKDEVKDLTIAAREQKKTLSELVEDRKKDEKAKEELRKDVEAKVKDEKKVEDKDKPTVAEKTQQKVNEGAKAKQAEEGKKFNMAGGENK